MLLLEQLKKKASEVSFERIVRDVRIGLGYTAVMLDNTETGLAYTFREEANHGCSVFKGRRPIAGNKAANVLEYLVSEDILERTVGVATANALINKNIEGLLYGDFLEAVSITKADRVAMIGYFPPLINPIKAKAGELIVFEKNMEKDNSVLPESMSFEILPTCSVIIITATAIINNSFEKLSRASGKCRVKALLGASTPLVPDIFKQFGITHLSGVLVKAPHSVIKLVSEGGGARNLKGYADKVTLKI